MGSFPETYNHPIFGHFYEVSVTARVGAAGRWVRTTYLVVNKSSNLTCWPD